MSSVELRKFLIGTVVWGVGNQMVTVTQTYVIFDITQSALQLAILGGAVVVASISTSVVSGFLADRFSRKVLLMCGSVMTLSSMLAVGLLLITDQVEPWHIQIAGAIHGSALALDWTARFSLLPIMVTRNILPRAVFFDNSFFNLGRVLAPLTWGAIVQFWGYEWTYIAIAGIMAANFVIVAMYRPHSSGVSTVHQPIWQEVVEIASVVRHNPILNGNLTFTFVNALLMGGFIYLLTPISREVYGVGAGEYSQLFAAVGVGAFIGGLYLGFSGGFKRAGYALLISNVLTAGCAIVFALITGIYFGFAFAFLFGLMNSIHIGLSTISMQMAITENVRGRLAGLYELAWGGFPAGGFMFGALADGLGPSASLIIGCGFVLLVTGAIGALNPQLRRLRMRV
ncbi:MAG: MFS transporter [Chloroflexi bacterium]|nr:MFS transporter [Chloroflexota bacterium]